MSLSHTPPLRFRRTPAISFTPGPNTWAATHLMCQNIERFQALFAFQGHWQARRKDPTICNCRKSISEHLNKAWKLLTASNRSSKRCALVNWVTKSSLQKNLEAVVGRELSQLNLRRGWPERLHSRPSECGWHTHCRILLENYGRKLSRRVVPRLWRRRCGTSQDPTKHFAGKPCRQKVLLTDLLGIAIGRELSQLNLRRGWSAPSFHKALCQGPKVSTRKNLLALRVHTLLVEVLQSPVRLLSMTASGSPAIGVPRSCIAQLH